MKYSAPITKEEPIKIEQEEPKNEDPDVTQLEIDINTTSISNSGSQNFKKRQLIEIAEIVDCNSIQSNYLISPQYHNDT